MPDGLPYSLFTEVTVLGAALLDADALRTALDSLTASDFQLDTHQRIFRVIGELVAAGTGVDFVTVMEALRRKKELDSIGGPAYLASLSEGVPRRPQITDYVRIIKDQSLKRQGMREFAAAQAALEDGGEETQSILESASERIKALLEDNDDFDLQLVGEFLATQGKGEEALQAMEAKDGLMLGWSEWDKITGGLKRQEFCILAAMASCGKSAWAGNAVFHASVVNEKITAYFPLEQRKASATLRMISGASRIPARKIRDGDLSDYDRAIVLEHRARLAKAPLYIDDSSGMTLSRIKAKCSRLKRQMLAAGHPTGLDFVLIDQLSHTENTDVRQKGFSPEEIIGLQGFACKKMAQELDVPVVMLHQMTQEAGKRPDPRPRMTDLAGSGKLKNHADIVAFLHRPEMYEKGNPDLYGKAEMILAKNREGNTDIINCEYHGEIFLWEDPKGSEPQQQGFDSYYRDN